MKNHLKHLAVIAYILVMPSFLHGDNQEQAPLILDKQRMLKMSSPRWPWNSAQNQLKALPLKSMCITIPKSGTHLLSKCLRAILLNYAVPGHTPNPKEEERAKKCKPISKRYFVALQENLFRDHLVRKCKQRKILHHKDRLQVSFHLVHTPEHEQFVKQCVRKTLFLIRDPRDQLVSFVFWACKNAKLDNVAFNNMLLDFIDGKQRNNVYSVRMHPFCDALWTFGIAEYYAWYLPWMNVSNVYTIHFENLVGENGGGSQEAQIQEIHNIARHVGVDLSPDTIKEIADNLFGGTNTFNKGQIGSWKRHFTEEHKRAFKASAGQLLIDLGYEKDMNW